MDKRKTNKGDRTRSYSPEFFIEDSKRRESSIEKKLNNLGASKKAFKGFKSTASIEKFNMELEDLQQLEKKLNASFEF